MKRQKRERATAHKSPGSGTNTIAYLLLVSHFLASGYTFPEFADVRCIYLYTVVFPYVRGLSAYLHLYLYYILWSLAPR
jgi:hypothetical protein